MRRIHILTLILIFCTQLHAQKWGELQKLVASDRDSVDHFGYSVAIDGNYAIVGSYYDDEDELGGNPLEDAGSAYIYEKDSLGNWYEVQKIVPSDRATGDDFGWSVSISGTYAIVGADEKSGFPPGGGTYKMGAGAAYIFERDTSGSWVEVEKLLATNMGSNYSFGYSVSINNNSAIVAAFREGEAPSALNTNAGAAYIFERDSMTDSWNNVQRIEASDRADYDFFGHSVSIDGSYAVIGAFAEDEDVIGGNSLGAAGSAYIFEKDINGNWTETQKIVATDREEEDLFGFSCSMDNNYLVIGAPGKITNDSSGNVFPLAGAAYIYNRDSTGTWTEVEKVVSSYRTERDYFGYSVCIQNEYAIIGAWLEDEDSHENDFKINAGAAYIFKQDSIENWPQIQKIVHSYRSEQDRFGTSVAMSGEDIMVGAYAEDEDVAGSNTLNNSGSVYFFKPCDNTNYTFMKDACIFYTSPSGNYNWTTSGIYQDTIKNERGCDSILTINLTIDSVNTDVTQSAAILTASASTATYQWLNCESGNALIDGETNQTFTPTQNGSYAVAITENGCTDTSACYSIMTVGIDDNDFGKNLSIYPNPTKGSFTIDPGQNSERIFVRIQNMLGQNIPFQQFKDNGRQTIIFKAPSGIYFVEVFTNKGAPITRKILKE